MNKSKPKLIATLDLISKLIKNICDNPTEDKFKKIKRDNPKIKDALTKYKTGIEILKLIGFLEARDEETKDIVYKISSGVSVSFIKGRRLDFDSCVT